MQYHLLQLDKTILRLQLTDRTDRTDFSLRATRNQRVLCFLTSSMRHPIK